MRTSVLKVVTKPFALLLMPFPEQDEVDTKLRNMQDGIEQRIIELEQHSTDEMGNFEVHVAKQFDWIREFVPRGDVAEAFPS